MTEPTDAEQYLNIADQCTATATSELAASILVDGGNGTLRQLLNDAADAIRAGWCAPPVVAGEPVAWVDERAIGWLANSRSGAATITTTLGRQKSFERPMPLHATPQPTQAQAGAVPLTDEQIDAAAKKLAECMEYPWEFMPEPGRKNMRKHAQDVIEAAHGIKGGQHGADT